MNVWLLPSRLRLWAARLLAAAGASLAVYGTLQSGGGDPLPLYAARLGVDAVALWLCGKRRFRFAAALWFGCSAFFHLVLGADRAGAWRGWAAAAAIPLAIATALLVWPMLRAPQERAPLAPLTGVWALVAALLVTAVDAALFRVDGGLPRDTILITGATSLALFAGCMLSSQLGPLRWLGQIGTVALIGAAQTSELRSFTPGVVPAMELGKLVVWMGLGSFAVGLDWIRAGATGRARFLRAGGLSLG
ncbi:MAG TPA: hypothetical protein VND93_25140, partial [Myxococcales bacterium]|nr:hypothetical protein [Myxococcales bacterium]